MSRYKPYKYDQMVMVPISFQHQLEPGTLEYTINELVEHHIDLSVFEARYQNDSMGAKAIRPKLLLKVILFAYSRGMISSRQIGRACGENILFMAFSGGYCPDHSTLAHFVSSLQKEIESVFGNILLVCDERARLCQHPCTKTSGSFHPALESQGGCAVEVVHSGPQYW